MENFDVKNSVNPTLVKDALLYVNGEIFKVVDMDKERIIVSNKLEQLSISNQEWSPIELDESWLGKFNFSEGSKIRNSITDLDWVIKSTGNIYYLTIYKDPSFGDNPVIGLKYVHELQEWFYRLTKVTLKLSDL